jgi:hypothetical protein
MAGIKRLCKSIKTRVEQFGVIFTLCDQGPYEELAFRNNSHQFILCLFVWHVIEKALDKFTQAFSISAICSVNAG